jgi:transcriptional regulator with XRE-family HTH domain
MKDNPNLEVDVGHRLRELRASQGLSLRALAEKSGLNVNTLSLIENGKTSPSVSTLQQVAAALDVPITAFFQVARPPQRVIYQRAAERSTAALTHGSLADLGIGFTQQGLEPFLIQLDPLAGSGDAPIVHTGPEFVYCLAGRIVYRVEAQEYTLNPGDSLLFEAHLPHQWGNPEPSPAQALLVLCPAGADDRPTREHFLER